MTLDEVAAQLGTNRQQVIRWEKGTNTPDAYADALAELYELPVEEVRRPEPSTVGEMEGRVRRLEAEVAALRKMLRRLGGRQSDGG